MSIENDKVVGLEEFFEMAKKPMWQTILHSKIKKYGMRIWDIDVSDLLTKLLDDAYKKENLKHASLFVLICTILLKSKSRRIGIKELEKNIKEDLEELNKLDTHDVEEIDSLNYLQEEQDSASKYNELLELEAKLKRLFYRREKKLSEKTIKKFQYAVRIESYFNLKSKLMTFLLQNKETTYSQLATKIKTNNSLIMGLLLLNSENKIKIKQRTPFGEIHIKKV